MLPIISFLWLVKSRASLSSLEPLRLFGVFANHFHISSPFTSQTSLFRFSSFTYVCCLWEGRKERGYCPREEHCFLESVFFPFRLVFESLLTAHKRRGRREKTIEDILNGPQPTQHTCVACLLSQKEEKSEVFSCQTLTENGLFSHWPERVSLPDGSLVVVV